MVKKTKFTKSKLKKTKLKKSTKNKSARKVKKQDSAVLCLNQHIWPIERDVFFRPSRLKYVRKILKPQGCVFCASAEKPASVETLCIYKTKLSQIVINKFPYNSGHLLVLPLRHEGQVFNLSEEEYTDLFKTVRLAMTAIQEIYQPNGFNLGMNHGATAGAGIPEHLHFHIIPRWNGDLNFFPLIAETKLVVENVEGSYQRFAEYFKSIHLEKVIK